MTDQWPLVFTYISLLNLNMWIVNIRQVVSQDFNFHCKKLKHVLISLSLEAGVPTRVTTNFCFHSPSSPEYMQWKQKLATTDKFQRESLLLGHYRYPSNNMRNKLRLSSASGQNGKKKTWKGRQLWQIFLPEVDVFGSATLSDMVWKQKQTCLLSFEKTISIYM